MLFNSVIFIMIFLPLALAGWYILQQMENPLYARVFLVGMSFWFYGYYNPGYLAVLLCSLLVNYGCSLLFERAVSGRGRGMVLFLAMSFNLGSLFYYKYFNFFLDNVNFLFHSDWQTEKIMLPLGISFFTFQQISFAVDRYRGKAPHYGVLEYACFITFFPQLIAGPIVLHDEFIPTLRQRRNRKPCSKDFFDGIALFILGLGKKVLLADVLAIAVNAEYQNIPYLDAPSAWLTIILYMLELYFDFSGYCDMARGIGRMFGFGLPENFNAPLKAVSVKDFWKRWHMTLSRFLSSYVYIPLGGNRRGTAIKCRNLMAVFLLSGLWHGADWTFIVWGAMHGLAMVWETLFPRLRFRFVFMNRLATGVFCTLSFSIFRSDSLETAWMLWKKLFFGGWNGFLIGMCNTLQIPETYVLRKMLEMKFPDLQNPFYILCMALLLGISVFLIRGEKAEVWICKRGYTRRGVFLMAAIFTWSLISLSQVSTFLYFNF